MTYVKTFLSKFKTMIMSTTRRPLAAAEKKRHPITDYFFQFLAEVHIHVMEP